VLDDERRMVEILTMVLTREGYQVQPFHESEAALAALAEEGFDLLITDLRMPEPDGLEVVRRVKEIDREVPVILITAFASIPTALEAMRRGAFDYVQKPFDNDELKALVRRALDLTRLSRENRYLRAELGRRFTPDAIVAESEPMREALERARRAARSAATVLITGESGVGKEILARAVHFESDRVGEPFLAINCKALAPGVLESELFGHEKGAFTGAERARAGLFEQAEGGTLFLDEIGEIDAEFQGKLLRVLQERTVRRVGGDKERAVDLRLVVATNRDLRAEIESGRFRQDLYFRLAVIPIHLAPLRERREDVLPLARLFLSKWNVELGAAVRGWTEETEEFLLRHTWPGNVRELENAIERGVVLARGDRIELEDLKAEPGPPSESRAAPAGLREFLDAAAAGRIRQVLGEVRGRRAEAAARLGIDRVTLYRLMRKYGIEDRA
jgi:DNA-binding NtrC family response regulator